MPLLSKYRECFANKKWVNIEITLIYAMLKQLIQSSEYLTI
jgi:hypothetical protein